MQVFNGKKELREQLELASSSHKTIGFVPTMGALHQGHLSLMKQSLAENQITIVSIFVNPTQFNNAEDLDKYPRTLEADIEKIEQLDPNIWVYAPTVEDIYEGNTVSNHFDFDGLEHQMEGKFRPGHFDGVGTVVKLLFEIVSPNRAYMGEKDFQQLQIVKKLVSKCNLPVTVVPCPIFREENGLAMSSRNERLSADERQKASIIYQTLLEAKEKFQSQSAEEVTNWVSEVFATNDMFELEYFQIADEEKLLPCTTKESNTKYRAFIAVFVKNVRLIDTITFN